MGSLVNSVTAPLGVKLFSGGPYSDRGLSDASMAASKPLQAAGTNFLNLSQGQAGAGNPYAGLFNQIGQESGVNTPFGGTAGNTATPGALSGSYLDTFNNLKGHTEKARQNALSQLNSHLSARGLGDSSEARAHQAYLNSQFDNHLSDTMSQLQGQQHQERLQTLQSFINSLQGMAGLGGNLISGNVQNLNQNAQAATQRTNQGNAALGSAIGLGLGAGGVTPSAFSSPFQSQQMFTQNSPISSGGYNPYTQTGGLPGGGPWQSPFQQNWNQYYGF